MEVNSNGISKPANKRKPTTQIQLGDKAEPKIRMQVMKP
ncbi:hypothetical protein LPLWJ_33800 [Lactiplantibacillus plantarum WJL]|nr:hypothetical protein LPLWJ_33800 [Lactiplantibacillus plantarum WJL]